MEINFNLMIGTSVFFCLNCFKCFCYFLKKRSISIYIYFIYYNMIDKTKYRGGSILIGLFYSNKNYFLSSLTRVASGRMEEEPIVYGPPNKTREVLK